MLFFLEPYPIGQTSILSVVQLALLVWTVTASIKASRYDNIKEAIDITRQLIILTLKGVSSRIISEYAIQYYIGGSIAIALLIMLLNNIIFMIVAMIIHIIAFIKSIKSKCFDRTNNARPRISLI